MKEIKMRPDYKIEHSGISNPKSVLVFNYESDNEVHLVNFSEVRDKKDFPHKPIARFIIKEKVHAEIGGWIGIKNNIQYPVKEKIGEYEFEVSNRIKSKLPLGQFWLKKK